jgi:allantoinase
LSDLAIRGAIVVSDGTYERDIIVRDGRVAALVEPGASAARETIDARGLLALPGVVDAHVHFNEPGRTEWEGWRSGSAAAAAGGTTTVIDMPLNSLPPVLDGASFDAKREAAERASLVDFALWGGLVGTAEAPLRELARRGAVGCKAFLCDSGVPEFPALGDDDLVPALRAATSAGLMVALHAEDAGMVREATDRIRGSGQHEPLAWASSRPALAEARAIARACAAAKATNARVHVVHLSAALALGAIGVARGDGVDVSVETCPHYLVFDEEDVARQGPSLKCAPPIRDRPNADALWEGASSGRIDLIASDHSPCPPSLKARGIEDIFDAWGGIAGAQSLLHATFTEASRRAEEVLDVRRVAGFVAWRLAVKPAQRFGLWPRKGRIAAGSDADVVLFDPDQVWTYEATDSRTRGVDPYAGRTFRGRVRRTIVRGRTVYEDGEIVVEGGGGFVARAAS